MLSHREIKGSKLCRRAWAWVLVAVVGLAGATWCGSHPYVAPPRAGNTTAGGLSADLALYRDLVADVQQGLGYHEAARIRIPRYGFPLRSPLNWRLPTTTWLLASLPSLTWGRVLLAGLSLGVLLLAWHGEMYHGRVVEAGWLVGLWAGVLGWALDEYAFLAQEPWAATFLAGALACHQLGERNERWQWFSAACGTAALLIRELALPFCLVMALDHGCRQRWRAATLWTIGILLFAGYYAWHLRCVQTQWALGGVIGEAGLDQWWRLGGLGFVLRTLRMNVWLFAAPAWLLWLYLVLAGWGLARARDTTSNAAGWSVALYVLAFALAGRPENMYWGLVPAPLLAWGASRGIQLLRTDFTGRDWGVAFFSKFLECRSA